MSNPVIPFEGVDSDIFQSEADVEQFDKLLEQAERDATARQAIRAAENLDSEYES
jgi:hypothetical protein